MSFFNFIQQQNGVRVLSDFFGEKSPFLVAHITRRSANQLSNGVFFRIFAHIEPDKRNPKFCRKHSGQLGLAHTGRSHK